jgi:hypothetical protein
MTLMGDEPEIGLGDSGEHVTQLQDRLRGLQFLQEQPDGAFGDSTEQALRQFQQSQGLEADGRMSQPTWEALDRHMLDNGLQYNAYAGPGNQQWDQPDWGQQGQDPWGQPGQPGQGQDGQGDQWGQPDQGQWGQEGQGDQWGQGQWGQGQWGQGQWGQEGQGDQWGQGDGQSAQPGSSDQSGQPAASAEAPVIPHIDNIHPNIAQDERFSSFHDFLRENAAQ